MKTVPLHGKNARGRVALVDDGDYELVMRYRWNVWELNRPGFRPQGPYAVTSHSLRMHKLITGWPITDHQDHSTLNNQRYNLRPATVSQNMQNRIAWLSGSSQYKGLCWLPRRRKWLVTITLDGHTGRIGEFVSEMEAAYAYDEAARRLFGEFAYPNFPEGPAQAMRDRWEAEREQHAALMAAKRPDACSAGGKTTWERRAPESRICEQCGAEYWSRSTNSLYCGYRCRRNASLPAEAERKRQRRAREREVRLF